MTFNIKDTFGGMTASLLKRAKIFGEQRDIPVTIVTFAMNYELRENVEKLKGNKIGDNTKVVNLYEFYSGDKFKSIEEKTHDINEKDYGYLKYKNKRIYKIFNNGKLIMEKDFESYDGKLSSISYINDELVRYKKEEFDKSGYLRRTIYYDIKTKKMRQIQFYRMDGSCYLTKHLNYNGKYEVIKIYAFDKLGNVVNEFKNDEEMKRHFLDSITNEHKNNFMIVDSKAMFSEIIKYKNPTKEIYKIYMNHNPHTKFPFNYDSKIREAMKPKYDNLKSHDAIIVLTEEQKVI